MSDLLAAELLLSSAGVEVNLWDGKGSRNLPQGMASLNSPRVQLCLHCCEALPCGAVPHLTGSPWHLLLPALITCILLSPLLSELQHLKLLSEASQESPDQGSHSYKWSSEVAVVLLIFTAGSVSVCTAWVSGLVQSLAGCRGVARCSPKL